MHVYRIVWEDEAKAREVEILVDYHLTADLVTVAAIRPVQVTFYEGHTAQPTRSIPVHTAAGRHHLTAAYLACRSAEQTLEDEIRAAHDLLDDAVAVG
ncbi:MAG: hypothetical protein SFU86_02470 [Pirellulaceae bacterium]|nr:hypothetical protein [Pirellulaceae bacterium]